MRFIRFLIASSTTTMPYTLTCAPRSGSARTNGHCREARCTTFVIPCSSSVAPTVAPSVTSPSTSVTRARSSSESTSRTRASSEPRSNPTGSSPKSSSAFSVQAPRQPRAPVTSVRCSAKRRVLVDGDGLGIELDGSAALLVRPPRRALETAERDVHVRPRRLRVHVDDPGLDLAGEALRLAEVAREDRRGEPEADGVRTLHRLVEE